MRFNTLAFTLHCLLLNTSVALANDTKSNDSEPTQLEPVTVIATRSESELSDTPASLSVIQRERIDQELVVSLKDLFRYEPGISVSQAYGRFGIGDVRIRGIGGNRVQMQIDGADIADSFSIGSFSNAGRDYVDPEVLERVEILRGPGSALYGSDALGGVIQLRTREPKAFLDSNTSNAVRARLQTSSEDNGIAGSALYAAAGDQWSGLLQIQRREASERNNFGNNKDNSRNRTAPDPQQLKSLGVLAKLQRSMSDAHRIGLSLDAARADTDTNVLSSLGAQNIFGSTVSTNALRAEDETRRQRLSIFSRGTALDLKLLDEYDVQLYRQISETEQYTRDERSTLAAGASINPTRRERWFNFEQDVHGAEILLRKTFADAVDLHYGLSFKQTSTDQRRDGISTNLGTGAVSNTIAPDVFPVRDFPLSETSELGVFLQSELRFIDQRLKITPALRWDRYKLQPALDDIFAADNPGITPVGIRTSHLSPKISASWNFNEQWMTYINAAEGFRAPPYNDANIGFTNFAFGYTAIPNPDLRPETSRGIEIGLKTTQQWGSLSLAAYHNRYDDFIESLRSIGVDPATGLLVFQSQNINEVRIKGVELSAQLNGDAFNMPGWKARFSYAHAQGDDLLRNTPLNSIDPDRAVLGISYSRPAWRLELAINAAERHSQVTPVNNNTPQFVPPGYAAIDLLGSLRLGDWADLHFGVINLADRKYWDWADVPGISASSSVLDRYTRPGRSLRIALSTKF